jgi:hypothetical protein
MARGTPTTQVSDPRTGAVVALTAAPADGDIVAAATGDLAAGGPTYYARVANGSGGSINVTLVNPQTLYGDDVADRVVAVAAGVTRDIPLPASFRQDLGTMDVGIDVGNKILINYSSVTTVTRGIVRY